MFKEEGPEKLGEILSRLITQRGLGQVQRRTHLEDAWDQAAGPQYAPASRVGSLKHGQLEIIVADAVVHHELSFLRSQLLRRLAESLGHQQVKGLRFRLGVLD